MYWLRLNIYHNTWYKPAQAAGYREQKKIPQCIFADVYAVHRIFSKRGGKEEQAGNTNGNTNGNMSGIVMIHEMFRV
ncbi:MAG: hypothetical protein Q7V05_08410 [Methanoregula sp.]|nr:hypothetical protein [Methanoregula sp.]